MAAMRDYVPARYEASTYIMSMASATVMCHCQVAYRSINGPNLKCSLIELPLRISEFIALIFYNSLICSVIN